MKDLIDKVIKIKSKWITPTFSEESHSYFIKSIEILLKTIIPKDFFEEISSLSQDEINHNFISNLLKKLPIVHASEILPHPSCFSFVVLCSYDFTDGVDKFIPKMLSRWLTPGYHINIPSYRSLTFSFSHDPKKKFYICEYFFSINDKMLEDMIKKNLNSFIKELRLNILSVYHARSIVSMKKLSLEQQSAIIKENIFSLIKKPSYAEESTNQIQNLLVKHPTDKKLSEIEKNLAYLMHKRPRTFDRDIFSAVHNMIFLFPDNFTTSRDPRHISRIIGFQYLFRKIISQQIYHSPDKRHISIKLLKTRLSYDNTTKNVLGFLITLNFVNETERFKKNHILEAIWYCLQDVKYVEGSYVVDRRDEKIRSYYLEIEKNNTSNGFFTEEIKILKKRLPQELVNRIENPVHPIFMPRNEEEVLRNIILLRKQLKYVRDLPQVIISYDKQTGTLISFNVILVQLIKAKTQPLKKLFSKASTFLKVHIEETKKIGYLKKKYPIESNILRISIKKTGFFRQDLSLDLQKARQCIAKELVNVIGNFRDYNGGMILKQSQALEDVKKLLDNKNEVLLENFFYSITPGVMQSILPPFVIKKNVFATSKGSTL